MRALFHVLPVQVELLLAVGANLLRADDVGDVGFEVAVVIDEDLIARARVGAQRRGAEDAGGRVDGHSQDGMLALGKGVDVVDVEAAVSLHQWRVQVVGCAGAQRGQAQHHGQRGDGHDDECADLIHLGFLLQAFRTE